MAEIDCLVESVPHICAPDYSLAEFAENLAWSSYSCLANTVNGLPSQGFYVFADRPSMLCCDQLVVHLEDSRRFKMGQFSQEILNVVSDSCDAIGIQHELQVTLMRPCVSVLDEDGQIVKSSVRNEYGKNFLVDVQTLMCCISQCLDEETGGPCGFGSYYIRPARYEHRATCMRVTIPVVVGGGGEFRCCDCERDIDITPGG